VFRKGSLVKQRLFQFGDNLFDTLLRHRLRSVYPIGGDGGSIADAITTWNNEARAVPVA
jgi:hypothetical protein